MARVLIAEDSAVLAKIARAVFEKAGHAVVTAPDGRAAIEAARRERPDVVVMDAEMPVLGGLEALRALKADPATADIPVHIYTGHEAGGPEAEAFRKSGASGLHVKPYRPEILLSLVPE